MILLIGFGPFGRFSKNISSQIVREINSKINYHPITRLILPVSWNQSKKKYKRLIATLKMKIELVILLGIHSSRNIYIEKFAWNIAFGKDNENKLKFGLIRYSFPFHIKTTLNANQIYLKLKDRTNISISYFAGLYLCNYIYYWALFLSKKEYPVIFIHIPHNIKLDVCLKKIEEIIKVAINMQKKK